MSLFRWKIDVFSSFTISQGPLYVERVLDYLLKKEGKCTPASAGDRLKSYISYLKSTSLHHNNAKYRLAQFYLGHFYQQLAHETKATDSCHYLEKALCHYERYLDLNPLSNETVFYAQWQAGIVQNALRYPWELAEASFVKANTLDHLRGEGNKHIVFHYMRGRDWQKAYSFSQTAARKFFDHNPIAIRRWYIEFDAYDWHVLDSHMKICYKLGYLSEAISTYHRLLEYETDHLSEFKDTEIRHMHTLEKLFYHHERVVANA